MKWKYFSYCRNIFLKYSKLYWQELKDKKDAKERTKTKRLLFQDKSKTERCFLFYATLNNIKFTFTITNTFNIHLETL